MSERNIVYKTLFSGWRRDIPDTAEGVVSWLQGLLARVPEEHRSAVEFEIDYEGELTISLERPETDAEMAERLANESASARKRAAERERTEREMLAELKHRYEGGPAPPPKPASLPDAHRFLTSSGIVFVVAST